MIKKILIIILGLLILAIIARIVFIAIEQKNEFNYHCDIPKSINFWSDDFRQGDFIPTEFTGFGRDVSPSLYWDNLPQGTQSIVIIAVDYDAPSPIIKFMTIDHWIIFNISPDINHLDKAITHQKLVDAGMKLGINITGGVDYVGPNPPLGTHKYYFRIYALSIPSIELTNPTKKELMEKMKNNIIAYGELIGKYKK
jgi:Raf kinase inhibitor-like YbhB/YbcL family protein